MAWTGRPSKYKEEYCETVVKMGEEGKTFVQMACFIGVHTDTLAEWASVHPAFSVAIRQAKLLAEAYWTEKAQSASESGGSYGMMRFYLSARFGWTEKTEVAQDITTKGEKVEVGPLVIAPASHNEA